jgi:hypothetical protein
VRYLAGGSGVRENKTYSWPQFGNNPYMIFSKTKVLQEKQAVEATNKQREKYVFFPLERDTESLPVTLHEGLNLQIIILT